MLQRVQALPKGWFGRVTSSDPVTVQIQAVHVKSDLCSLPRGFHGIILMIWTPLFWQLLLQMGRTRGKTQPRCSLGGNPPQGEDGGGTTGGVGVHSCSPQGSCTLGKDRGKFQGSGFLSPMGTERSEEILQRMPRVLEPSALLFLHLGA